MGRSFKRKKPKQDPAILRRAVAAMALGSSLRAVAREFAVPRSTLLLHRRNNERTSEGDKTPRPTEVNISDLKIAEKGFKTVFSKDQEESLEEHLLRLSDIYFGLNPTDARVLAYKYAIALNVSYPSSWDREEMSGLEWFRAFMSRHPRLSLRKPEATSLARASAFNPTNVAAFFANYFTVMDAIKVGPSDIWNVDETGVSTVHRAARVISRRGQKRVGHITSGERGNLVTLVQAVSATGMRAPPFFVFPRARFQPHFLNGGSVGANGGANPSGWITAELFVEFLKTFQAFTRCDRDHPILLLLDNHESHCSLAALQFCRDNGIHVVSFPPHCSHRLQPLDVGVFKPFKTAINKQFDTFMRMNPRRVVQIFDIPAMVSRALEIGVNEVNIKTGFRSTGIWPIDAEVFQDIDFMPSATTDRANPNDASDEMDVDREGGRDEEENPHRDEGTVPSDTSTPRGSTSLLDATVESLLPLPKAPPRSQKKRGRLPGRTSILTSDAEVQRSSEKEKAKKEKKRNAEEKAKKREENRKQKLKEKEEKITQREKKQRQKEKDTNGEFQPRRTTRRSAISTYREVDSD